MEGTLVLGVDAGSTNVVAVLADVSEGEPRVIGTGVVPSAGVRKGVVVDPEAAGDVMRQAVAKACEMAEQPGVTQAVVAVSGGHVRSLVGEAEVAVHRPTVGVTKEDLRQVLDQAAAVPLTAGREVIHVAPRSYQLDESEGVREPLGMAGRRLWAEALLITGDSLPLQNHLRVARSAGLEVIDYQVAVRAAGRAVLTPEERDEGVLLLDFGAATTGVAVYDKGHLIHVGVVPIGGDHVTNDIAAILRVPVVAAEEIKRERGWATPSLCEETTFELVSPSGLNVREVGDKYLAEIIQSRIEEILGAAVAEVKRSGYAGLFPGGLVLTGGASRLSGLREFAADSLCLPARVGTPSDPLVAEPEMATAAGLVRWGADLAREEATAAAEAQQRDKWRRAKDWLKALFQ